MMSGQSPYHTMADELSMDIDNNDLSLYSSDLPGCKDTSDLKLNLFKPQLVSQEVIVDDHSSQATDSTGDLEQLNDDFSVKADRSGADESDYVVELDLDPEESALTEASSQKVYTVLEPAGCPWPANKIRASEESMDSGFGSQKEGSIASRHSFTSLLSQENDTNDCKSWLSKHPDHWTPGEVLDWVYDVADEENIDTSQLRGEAFSEVDGPTLCSWSKVDFIKADPQYGVAIYEQFRILCGITGELLPPDEITEETGYNHQKCVNPLVDDMEDGFSPIRSELDPYLPQASAENTVQIGRQAYPIDPKDTFEDITLMTSLTGATITQAGIQTTSMAHCNGGLVKQLAHGPNVHQSSFTKGLSYVTGNQQTVVPKPFSSVPVKPAKRGRGRPRKNLPSVEEGGSDGEYTPYKKQKPGTGQRGGPRGKRPHSNRMLHLWEFIRDLLLDPEHNPSLIRWENRREGVFRVIRSKDVARMWGVRKQNPEMTYEKFSRSMRFCRTAGYFGEVPKDGKYPKKLCFAFGDRAHGWQPNSVVSNCFYQKA